MSKSGDFERLEELFHAALSLPESARQAFLEQECRGNEGLLGDVQELLAHDAHGTAFGALAVPADGILGSVVRGQRIGPYEVVRELGRGGMGTVYLASRADREYRKEVAIKLVGNRLSAGLISRFRTERQILASLEHAHIARLLDGGTTDDDFPYVVMEYVDGQRIDVYCDQNKLSVRQRLELFRILCSAVQHAHRNLVVHRDIKPSNVLVSKDGTPKLLDFGIAKLLGPERGASSETLTAYRPLTPDYASPEQIRGEPVSTATDVYSLGVLLYELLTGQRPYAVATLTPLDMQRAICEQQPERPSTAALKDKIETTGAADAARNRRLSPKRLSRHLAGDLDNIVLTALRKEPERRYPSVEALSEDVLRYLTGRPVAARKDKWLYRGTKFVRRHAVAVSAAVLVAAAAALGVLGVKSEAERAARESAKASAVASFLTDIFEASDPGVASAAKPTLKDVLDEGAWRIRRQLHSDPRVRTSLLVTIGSAYASLSEFERALELLEEAEAAAGGYPERLSALLALGRLQTMTGNYERAEEYLHTARAAANEMSRSVEDQARVLALLAANHYQRSEFAEAAALGNRALALLDASPRGINSDAARIQLAIATALTQLNRFEEAEELYKTAIDLFRNRFPDQPRYMEALEAYAVQLIYRGRYGDAEPLMREALALAIARYGDRHYRVASTKSTLGIVLDYRDKDEEAEGYLREAVDLHTETLGDHRQTAQSLNALAAFYINEEDFARAEPLALDCLEMRRRLLGDGNVEVGLAEHDYAMVLERRERLAEALLHHRSAYTTLRGALGDGHWMTAGALGGLARAQRKSGLAVEAEQSIGKAIETMTAALDSGHFRVLEIEIERARVLHMLGRTAAALTLMQEVFPAYDEVRQGDPHYVRPALEFYLRLAQEVQEPSLAEALQLRLAGLSQ